jgi:hypothetical protein
VSDPHRQLAVLVVDAESSLDQLSFELVDPAGFKRVRGQDGPAGVPPRVVRRQNMATATTRG